MPKVRSSAGPPRSRVEYLSETDPNQETRGRARPPFSGLSLLGFVVALAAIMLALLIGDSLPPERAQALCLYSLKLPGPARLLLNCDSNEFMLNANDPASLLEPGAARQTRPALIIAAYVGSFITAPIAKLIEPFMPQDPGDTVKNVEKAHLGLRTLLPVYLSYLALNLIFLVGAFLFYTATLREVTNADTVLATGLLTLVGFLLAGNDVVKAFVWSPHTQMLNIFIPVLGCWLLTHPIERSIWSLVLWSLALAIGILGYAAFVILLPCLIGSQILARHARGSQWLRVRSAAEVALVGVLSAIPVLLWGALLHLFVGSITLIETSRYHEVVWIAEAWAEGPRALLVAVGTKSWFFLYRKSVV